MEELILDSHGKINLGLDVLYKRTDGYHEINTIMQEIDLKDRVILKNMEEGIKIESTDPDLPIDESNLAYKAWEKIREKTGVKRGIHIKMEKNIPIAAGLAGGSSNGATVLKGLNRLWDLKLSEKELMDIGVEIGADIPFCILGGTARAEGIGEKLTSIKNFSGKMLLLANPGIPVSTPYVYGNLNLEGKERIDIDSLVEYIEENDLPGLASSMENIMEEVVIREHPLVGEIKDQMMDHGALGALMTGSGPTVFGFFDDEEKLKACKKELEKTIEKVFLARTI